jgi:hypothetical protein
MPKQIEWTEELPPCDFCAAPARFDGKTKAGPWANMCADDLTTFGYPESIYLTFERV